MNSLSWMIYLAEVCGSFSAILSLVGAIGLLAVGVVFLFSLIASIGGEEDDSIRLRSFGFAGLKWAIPALLIAAVLPSKEAVFAIVASEAGERALQSPAGDKAIKAWLDKQITPSKPDDGK